MTYFENSKNECYTYFSIHGDFKVDELCKSLEVEPIDSWESDDEMPNGETYDEAYISCNRSGDYDVFTSRQMEKTIAPFENKIDLLIELKKKYNLKYYLEIVPELHIGEVAPALAPSAKVIEFCYKTGTELDVDLYVLE